MIKVERMGNGYMIEMDGANGDLIEEIAHAAAAYHVRAIKGFRKEHGDLDTKHAIGTSVRLFGLMMAEAMRKQLGVEEEKKEQEPVFVCEVIPFDDAKKGGPVQ